MKPDSWYGSRHALLISSVLVPPVGLVLLWVRSGTGAFRKLFGTAPILLLGIFYFHLIFGIHVEFDGSAGRRRLIVSLHNPERRYAAIELDRAVQGDTKLKPKVETARYPGGRSDYKRSDALPLMMTQSM